MSMKGSCISTLCQDLYLLCSIMYQFRRVPAFYHFVARTSNRRIKFLSQSYRESLKNQDKEAKFGGIQRISKILKHGIEK